MKKVYKFTTTTCGVCRMLEPIWQTVKEELKDSDIQFFESVIDKNPSFEEMEIVKKYSVSKAPTIIVFDNNMNLLQLKEGFLNKRELKKMINS